MPTLVLGRDGMGPNSEEADFKAFVSYALDQAMSRGEATLDVLIWDAAGALTYGGDDAVERYSEDPEASVFERFEIKVNCAGRVP